MKNNPHIRSLNFSIPLIVRYVFIFWLKNPACLLDDFWNWFLSVWIVGFSAVTQFVFMLQPGIKQLIFY